MYWRNHSDGSPQLVEYAVYHISTYRGGHGCGTINHVAKLQCLKHTPSSTPDPRAGAGGSQHPQGSSYFSLDGQDTGRRSLYGVGIEFWLHLTSEWVESSGCKVSLAFSWALYFLHLMNTDIAGIKWGVRWGMKKALNMGPFAKKRNRESNAKTILWIMPCNWRVTKALPLLRTKRKEWYGM